MVKWGRYQNDRDTTLKDRCLTRSSPLTHFKIWKGVERGAKEVFQYCICFSLRLPTKNRLRQINNKSMLLMNKLLLNPLSYYYLSV